MVGNYAALIIKIADGQDWSQPAVSVRLDQIVGYMPVWECQLRVTDTEMDRTSERYGEPKAWAYQEIVSYDNSLNTKPVQEVNIHWTRVVYFGDVATYLDSLLKTRYKVVLCNDADYLGVRCRQGDPPSLNNWEFFNGSSGPGTAGAIPLPTQTSGLMRFFSNTIGKNGEGRSYLPFPAAADNTGLGQPSAGYQTAGTSIAGIFANQQTVTGGTGGVWLIDPVLWNAATPLTSYPITDWVATGSWATQRRRGSYGRFNKPPF